MITTTKIVCAACGNECIKKATEIKRQQKKGKKLFYCNLSCAGKINNSHLNQYKEELKNNTGSGKWLRKKDEYSQFRYHLKNAKQHCRKHKDLMDIDLEYLKVLWKQQNGKCAVTGIDLQVKHIHTKTQKTQKNPYQASLDRIDNNRGYIKGNVRFVCYMFNIARNDFSDTDVLEFCKKVAINV